MINNLKNVENSNKKFKKQLNYFILIPQLLTISSLFAF